MTRIPIDMTAPIACTASSDEIPIRIEQIDLLRAHAQRAVRTDDGLFLHFTPDTEVADLLERFVADEKSCCQFWGFVTTRTDDSLTLLWTGPLEVQHFIDELLRYFHSDQPLTAFSGLL